MHPGCKIDAVYLCRAPIDFRKSIDGLAGLVEQELGLNPFGTALYAFINRRRDKIKVLYWHRNGFCLWYKRLEQQRFAWPAPENASLTHLMTMQELEWLLEGFDLWAQRPHKTLHYQVIS
jgi:transposase